MSARGEHGWPDAGMAQTRIVAPASGMPRVLKTMSSLREPCALAGEMTPGHTCSASAANAHRSVIVLARVRPACAGRRDAIFDRIIGSLLGGLANGLIYFGVDEVNVAFRIAGPASASRSAVSTRDTGGSGWSDYDCWPN